MVTAITGASFGDEGKGKITDLLAKDADVVVRFQGGANAGHTIINDMGKFVLHLLPSGVFHQGVVNVIAGGVAFNADVFFKELRGLEEGGVPRPDIKISTSAQLLPFHVLQDRLEEERLEKNSFGSTKSGIAPFYSDKYAKKNIQIAELYSNDLEGKIERLVDDKNALFEAYYGVKDAVKKEELIEYLGLLGERLKPYLCDCPYYMNEQLKEGKNILFEGQLGSLRDVDNGIYPYVTSSSPLAGFASVSAGIPPYAIKKIVSVVKAYSTCVGAGPFVGELFGDKASELRDRGGDSGEYGATTGRPRRMAYFDCAAARYGCMIQGTTDAALTMLDVYSYLDKIPIIVGYEIDGKVTDRFPETYLLGRVTPIYEYLDGWRCDISRVKDYDDLPNAARAYVEFIEKQIGVPVTLISNGPSRDQIIYRGFEC